MKLAILLMDYPVVSETFVARDIKTFLKNKCKVSVFTLRNKRGESQNSQGENFELNPTRENVNSLIEAMAAIYRILFWAIFVIFSEKKVIEKLKLIYLVPRAHQITEHLLVNKYDIIHLYWGHYPSLVGLMLKRRDKKQSVSLFLGAYDMEKNLEISKDLTHSDWIENSDIIIPDGIGIEFASKLFKGVNIKRITGNSLFSK